MVGIKDFINTKDVVSTHQEGKYVCFILKNGIRVKINPNDNIKNKEKE